MLLAMNNPGTVADVTAYCPTCHHRARFSFAGEQRWPRRVAEAAGLDAVVRLWNCGCCHTTVSERELKQ